MTTPYGLATTTASSSPRTRAGAQRPAAMNGEFAWEWQLRDHRRAHGLCFKCGDLYSREHRCKQPTQLLAIQLGDHGEVLTGDGIHAMDLLEEPPPPAPLDQVCCVLSTHAVPGGEAPCTIRLRALVGNQVMLLLVDSRSTHNFIPASFANRIAAESAPISPVEVRAANSDRIVCDKIVLGVQWWLQVHTFTTDMHLLKLGAYDGVLGMDWLEQFSPMTCHWLKKTLTFEHMGKTVKLQGMQKQAVHAPKPLEPEQFNKWQAGNEIGTWHWLTHNNAEPSH
ncbi:pentatricopeptide repeat-containing protein [Hordeum vulgare]|nr:pentatricopeptide repeat-containing protein [Hordeum vulgare]